jgi:hypothetical protein
MLDYIWFCEVILDSDGHILVTVIDPRKILLRFVCSLINAQISLLELE